MTPKIDLDRLSDHAEAVRAVAAELEAGKVVAVPDDCGMLLLALPGAPAAVERLQQMSQRYPDAVGTTAIADGTVAFDFVEKIPEQFEKLSSRCWPGPAVLRVGSGKAEALCSNWPVISQNWGLSPKGRALYVPGHRFAYSLLGELPSPAIGLIVVEPEPELIDLRGCDTEVACSDKRYTEGPTIAVVGASGIEIEREGVVSQTLLRRLTGEIYLFVCTGNTCRSPMAEGLFRRMLADHLGCQEDELLDRGYTVISAGLAAYPGAPASRESVELLKQDGIDISAHESQPVTEDLLFHCDHILTMTRNHLDSILQIFPELHQKARLLSVDEKDVSDPIGGGPEEYARCKNEIQGSLRALLPTTGTAESATETGE